MENTIQDALRELYYNDKNKKIKHPKLLKSFSQNSAYSNDYEQLFKEREKDYLKLDAKYFLEHGKLPTTILKESKSNPKIGDIFILKIKLNNTKENKDLYLGYERRPILIINVNNDLVDGLEIAHSTTFQNMNLIPIGVLPKDSSGKVSYVNIYNANNYKDLPTTYEFAKYFDKHIPQTKYEVKKMLFAQLNLKTNPKKEIGDDDIFTVEFTKEDNYDSNISEKDLNYILEKLKELNQGENKK